MEKVLIDEAWKKKLIRHIGTAKGELDLALIPEQGQSTLLELKNGGQLVLPFLTGTDSNGLKVIGEYHHGAELILCHLFDQLGITTKTISIGLLCQLVVAGILYPVSKRRTATFLN
ncbi:MAG: hypothetical protein HKL80_07320 [Acidimicrobiales bacterium]|nr:hypothetical protein [Acidimicrobiales bacterium]